MLREINRFLEYINTDNDGKVIRNRIIIITLIIIFALIFIFGIISCEKYDTLPEPYVDPDVIENFTYDEDGVVYQLINDLDSIIYEMSYDTTIFVVFDSILVIKFHIPFLSHQYDSAYKYTSFLKFGQKEPVRG